MKHTLTLAGRTYQVGDPGTPLHLATIAPTSLPTGWAEIDVRAWCPEREYGRGYRHTNGLKVLVSASLTDRKRWLHVSVTHRGGRYPTWLEMCEIKTVLCGEDATAYQIHPSASKHVNIHTKCLHLFCCLDGPVTPDFTGGGETI